MSDFQRSMGIDHGQVRLGIALSDPLGMFARPYRVITRKTLEEDFEALRRITEEEQVSKIIVGLPTDSEGGIGPQAKIVVRWARRLARAVNLPVVFWDESYSSTQAHSIRRTPGKGKAKPIDDVAAAAMLQEYLDAKGTEDEPGKPLETL